MEKNPLEDIYLIFVIVQTVILIGLGVALIKLFVKILPLI